MTFSIITCTYNSAKYLQKNIDSIESQTYADLEHIFIDGFSTDGTLEIITAYQQKYPSRVKLFQSAPQGISHAMNEGIERSSGEYLIHLHSDDCFYDKNVLADVAQYITDHGNPDMVSGKAKLINEKEGKSMIMPHRKFYQKKLRFWLLLVLNYIPHQAVFLKKNVFERYGTFDENLKTSMDDDLWIRLSREKIVVRFIDRIICNFSIREDTQSNADRFNDEFRMIYKKHFHSPLMIKVLCVIERAIKLWIYKRAKV